MIRRGAHEWQPQSHVDRTVELQRLERDQPLVMIHRDRRVEAELSLRPDECSVRRERPAGVDAGPARATDGRDDHARFFVAEQPMLARVRIEAEHPHARPADSEPPAPARISTMVLRESVGSGGTSPN